MTDLIQQQEYELVPIDSLVEHPENPRQSNMAVIRDSIKENGFYGAVIVQKSTGYTIAGWHRGLVLKELGSDMVPRIVVDVDDATALRMLTVDNQSAHLGTFDQRKLADVLEQIAGGDVGLLGTGFTNDDLSKILRDTDAFGDAAGDFLGGFGDEGDDPLDPADKREKDEEPKGKPFYVLNYSVTREQRDGIARAVRQARANLGHSKETPITSVEALVAICGWWLEGE